ncbi:MAG TPA: hypothetical protein PKD00_05790 [Burkholderiales bacterium]|nr:hypothetical protein [Burkholderiales bacterium]
MNNKLKLLLLSLNVSVALTACIGNGSDGSKTEQKVSDKSLLQNINNPLVLAAQKRIASLKEGSEIAPQLGYGFDNRTGLANAVNCLANSESANSITFANPRASINLTSSLSSAEMASLLNASIAGSVTYGWFSASVSAEYVKNSIEARHHLSYNYVQTLTLDATYKIPGIGAEEALSKGAQKLLSMGNDVFTSVCGDSYVSSSQVGAMLMISANIEFASAASKEAFSGSASGSISGIGSITGAFAKEINSSTKDAKLNINVIQLGGDASKLANIFGQKGPNGYYVVSCSAGNLADCNNAINAVIDYARGDFQKSIDIMNSANFKNYYTFNTNRMTYKQLGIFASLPDLTPEAVKAKDYLVKQIQADREMLGYLTRYQQQPFYNQQDAFIDVGSKDSIVKAIKDYTTIVGMYTNYDVLYSCYGSGAEVSTKCVKAADTIKAMRSQYQESINVGSVFAATYLMQDGEVISFKMIPQNVGNAITDTYSAGGFLLYDTNGQFANIFCMVDGTADNSLAYKFPDLLRKFFVCYGEYKGYQGLYGKRGAKGMIMGYKKDGVEIDFPLNPLGYNSYMSFSNDKDFKYNPI